MPLSRKVYFVGGYVSMLVGLVSMFLLLIEGAKTLGCGYYHKVSSLMQVGVQVSKPLAKTEVDIEFGLAYKLDKDTTVKSKVASDGMLCCSYKQKINAMTTMTLAAQARARPSARPSAPRARVAARPPPLASAPGLL